MRKAASTGIVTIASLPIPSSAAPFAIDMCVIAEA